MPGRFSFRTKQDELHNLNDRSTEVTKESAFRTREMLKLMHECQDAGVNTLQNLYDQGEKLNKAEEGLNATEAELDKAGVRLGNIKRKENLPCWLLPCASCFNKDPNKHNQDKGAIGTDTTSTAKDGNDQIEKHNFALDNSGTSLNPDTGNGNSRVQPQRDLNGKINISAPESKDRKSVV